MNPLKQKTTMKTKNMLWAALSMTAALVMTACSNDDNANESPVQQSTVKTIPYSVTVNEGATTRATVDSDNKTLKFADGDKLYITGTNIKGVLNIQTGMGETTGATFSGDLTYSGSGTPASDLSLTATLVSAQQNVGTEVSVDAAGAVTVNYPSTAYCSSVNDAVQKYSNLTGTSTYSTKSFSLTQQTAFLNFVITFDDGTTTGNELSAVVSNNSAPICTANVTTVTDNGVKAKFVLPVAKGTTLSSANVKFGDRAAISFGASQTLDGKVYNVTKTQAATLSLTSPSVGQVIGSDGKNYAAASVPSGVTKVAMIAYVSGSNGLAIALADEGKLNWATAKSTCEAKTPAFTNGTWHLPSQAEWNQMFSANGGDEERCYGLNAAITTAGGTALLEGGTGYWSSTPNGSNVWYVWLMDGDTDWRSGNVNLAKQVRACLAF
jgi:hypothetical protein